MTNSREKGRKGESEFLNKLGKLIGLELKRNLSQTRSGGADCIDLPGYALEIKRCAKLNRIQWWCQAVNQAREIDRIPVLAYRRNKEQWTVCVPPQGNPYCHFKECHLMTLEEFAARIKGVMAA